MKKILLIFSLILGIFCHPVFAAEIDLENIDAEYVFVGGSATITFDVFQGEPNQSYKYIFFGGPNDTNSINTFNPVSNQFLSINEDWSLMPSLTTNSNGYSRVEGIFSVSSNQSFCSTIDDYCYQLYVGIYNTSTAQEDSHSAPQPFVVLPLNFFSITPTPTTRPSFSPTSRPTSTTPTITPTPINSSTNSLLLPTLTPMPTINPNKFKTIASSSASLKTTPSSTLINNNDTADPNLATIQTGSNPEREKTEILGVYEPTFISNLGVKIFFIFLLTSISFTLYCLCFFDYTFRDLLPEINDFLSIIKPRFIKVFIIIKRLPKIIYQYFKAFFITTKTFFKKNKVVKKYINIIFQKLLYVLKISLNISQKIIKYFSHLFNQFFIFIKEHIHIKIPRKLKRYLYHKRSHTLSLIFLVFIGIFLIKPIFASIGPKINRNDTITTENNFLTQDINLEPKQDFSWGVLSFNSNKSIYSLGDTANLSMAVLDDKGAVVCDALLKLEIIMPDKTKEIFTTEDKQIKINSQCSSQEVTLIPDYQSFLKLTQLGEYQVILTAETKNGKYSIQDLFRVVQNSPFSVERISATRIYPLNSYPVNIKITANQDFDGTIVEKVPLSFTISQTDTKIETNQDNQLLKWDVNLKKDEIITLNYTYKAPETSPERYLLGPINMLSDSKTIFQENRSWQIASDAPGFSDGILVFVANGTIFNYKTWDGAQFGSILPGPTLTGNGIVRHVASAVSDDGEYVGVVAEVYNTSDGLHSVYGTVWDVDANQWINTSLLWSFTDTTADNIHQRYFDIVALGNDEFVVVGKEDPGTTLNNAGWLSGTGWTVEADLTTIGSIGKFVELIRRPGTTNLLLCTKDEALDTNCRYYKGATPYGTSANINDDWTGNTEIMTTSDDGQNWDSHAFFDSTDNTRGAIIINPLSATGLTIRARRFTVTDSAITYGNTADSAALSDDYARSLLAPIPGRSEALVLGAGILEDLKAYRVGITATTPNWTTIAPNLEGNGGIHATTSDINFNWAMEFDGTRGIVAWAQVGTTNPVHFRRWTIDGDFEASEQNINGSPDNGYNRTMIARRDPVATDEILFVALNDDVDINTVWWDGSADSFYTSGNKAWTEQANVSNFVQDSFWSDDFQFYPSPGRPILISPENSVTIGVTINPTFTMVSTDADADSIQYKIILGTDYAFVGTTQVFDQTISNVGWSGQNVGTSAYSSGTTASYIYQSTLDYSTVYFWKSQAIKSSESGTWSTSSDVYTFTTMDDPNGVVEVFSSVGSTDWIAPDNVSSVLVKAWGGGGGGGDGISGYGGAGGGGGAYVAGTMAVTSGNTYPIVVGNGGAGGASNGDGAPGADSTFNTNSFIAKGGAGGVGTSGMTGGSGGLASASTGTIKYDGGSGGIGYNATSDAAGGGGGAAGPHGSGIPGRSADTVVGGHGGGGNNNYGGIGGIAANGSVGSTGASDPLGGGGGAGGDNGTAGGAGGSPGAGGGGGEANTAVTGKGSGGKVIIFYKIDTSSQDPPSTPTLISPTDSVIGQSVTPTFQTVTTDTNGDNVQYELKICTDSDMSANCQTFDQTSSNVGWSGQDVGTSAYSSGTTATYILQVGNSLAENTTYYWKTRAKDYAGSASWSSTQSTPYSFYTGTPLAYQVTIGTDTTTVSTSDVEMDGMAITPGDGDYIVWFSGSNSNTLGSGSPNQYVSIYIGNSQVAHTERIINTEESLDVGSSISVATQAFISNVGTSTISVRWRTAAGTATSHQRTLTVEKIEDSNNISQATSISNTTTTNVDDTQMSDMTLDLAAGDYIAWFSTSIKNDTYPTTQNASIYIGSSQVSHSERQAFNEGSLDSSTSYFPFATQTYFSIGASDTVNVRWRTSSGTATADKRTLTVKKINPSNVTQVTAVGDTTTTSTSDTQLPGMIIVAPSTGNYLVWFSSSIEGTATNSNQTASIYVNGSQIDYSLRGIFTEESIPNTSFNIASHAYITNIGIGQTIEVKWKTSAGTATAHERTLTIQKLVFEEANNPPSTPNLISPSDSATSQSLTPTFKTVTTDANSDNLQYELKICTDSAMTTGCQTFDQTSSNVGWSGQDIGTSAYSSGTTATHILQIGSSLAENTTYFWKTRAKDYAGSASWSSTQTTAYSFTTNVRPNTPTLVSPGTGTTAVSQTPSLTTVTTDTNNDSLQYKIELATNDTFTQNLQTFDLSSSSTGWSGIDVGTSAYASGTTAVYIIPVGSSLATSTIYYWRSYAIDPTGTARWSTTQGTVYTFTTVSPILNQASFRWSDDDASGESRSESVGDTWYDSNYEYRTPVTVTNNVGDTLSDFQVRLTIDTSALIAAGKMQSDCDDIRFVNSVGATLSYWIVDGNCNTISTNIYVKVNSIGASGTDENIYVYYGNTAAAIASNGTNTFEYFDDFNDGIVNSGLWLTYPNVSEVGTTVQVWGTSYSTAGVLVSAGTTMVDGIVENRAKTVSGDIIGDERMGLFGRSTNNNAWGIINASGSIKFEEGLDFSSANRHSIWITNSKKVTANWDPTDATWYIQKTIYDGQSITFKTFDDLWGTERASVNTSAASNSFGYFGIQVYATSKTVYDWYLLRKVASTEPTISIGTETTEPPPAGPSGATWLAAENIGITGVSPNENIRLRFSIANSGSIDTANFRLQVAPKGSSTNCTDVTSGNFTDVTTTVGANLAVMTTSPNFTNQEATTNQLTDSSTTFVAGKMVEYDSNQSNSITLNTNEFTEVEYNFQLTNNVGSTTPYCFRTTNIDDNLSTYTNIAELTTAYIEVNLAPNTPYLPFVNNTTAQSGQQSPVYGLIDHTPAFSAVFDDPNTSDTASYYQLQVGSDSDWASAEIWDSAKTAISGTCNENSRCGDIVYGGGTTLVDGSTYYWRLKYWDNLDVGGTWSDTLQFSMNNSPSVGNVVINNNSSINLSENSSIGISWVATVTDADGYTNLNTAIGKLYRSGVGQSCSLDNNNCYQDTSCDFVNCTGNTCDALCSADLYFFTEATDTGSTFVDQYYQAWVEATDNYTEIGSTLSSSTTVDVNTLSAFSIGQSLVYGEVFAGSDTGSSNTITTVTNTGNSLINLEITGDYMCTDYPSCGDQSIEPQYQQYNLNTFTYGTGTTLSLSPRILNIGISKPTQSPSNSVKNLYWGIGIPGVKPPGNYQGSVTILVD